MNVGKHVIAVIIPLVSLVGCLPAPETPPAPPPTPKAAPVVEQATAEPAPDVVRQKAEAGVGAKGRDYEPGPVTTPIQAYFRAKERIAFDIQLQSAMNLFKATEDRFPKSREEFMEKVIKANMIQLPELPEGHKYVYDPATGQLLVEHP